MTQETAVYNALCMLPIYELRFQPLFVGFLSNFQSNFLIRNRRRHVKMDCIESVAMQLMEVLPDDESQAHQLRNANMMGSTYISVQAKPIKSFGTT